MTQTPDQLASDILDELRALRDAVELGIEKAATATAETARVEAKSDRRARIFGRLWVSLAVVIVLAVLAGAVGFAVLESHRRDDNASRACFQRWANATAQRSVLIAEASDKRIRALNMVLTIRAQTATGTQLQAAIKAAAAAGAAYERVTRDNPPIPPSTLRCAS